jgi:deoxyribose-phosphate aldolase
MNITKPGPKPGTNNAKTDPMNLAQHIDFTLLKPDCTPEQIRQLCETALKHQFASVCIPPYFVKQAAELLTDKPVKIATVIGYPMGYSATPAKVEEIKKALDDGADEVDAVINICAVKSANWNYVRNDMDSMATAVHLKGKSIKIIIETGLLTEAEIQKVCELALEIKPNFIKTSTGINGEGATVPVVQLLQQQLKGKIKIKASGGIRTPEDARRLIEAGAARIGASSLLV